MEETRACRVRLSEGPACQVRRTILDYPFHFIGRDKHAPPTSEGPACRVRRATLDNLSGFNGRDERAPPCRRDPPVRSGCHYQIRNQPVNRLTSRLMFCPPNPKLLVKTTSHLASRAVLGT